MSRNSTELLSGCGESSACWRYVRRSAGEVTATAAPHRRRASRPPRTSWCVAGSRSAASRRAGAGRRRSSLRTYLVSAAASRSKTGAARTQLDRVHVGVTSPAGPAGSAVEQLAPSRDQRGAYPPFAVTARADPVRTPRRPALEVTGGRGIERHPASIGRHPRRPYCLRLPPPARADVGRRRWPECACLRRPDGSPAQERTSRPASSQQRTSRPARQQ